MVPHNRMMKAFGQLLQLGILSVGLFSLLGYFGKFNRFFELTNHFRLQYFIGALIGMVVTLLLRKWRWALVAFGCLFLNALHIFPWFSFSGSPIKLGGQRIKLVQANVRYNNDQYDRVIAYLKQESPDIAVLQEVTETWAQHLAPLNELFQSARIEPQGHGTGIALYSKFRFSKAETLNLCADCRLSLYAQINLGTTPVNVMTIHPPTPIGARDFADRNRQFEAVATYLNSLATPKILIGDFNDTVWSSYHAQLLQQSQLVNVRKGSGLLPSWPSWLIFKPLMIPIDQCLVSPEIKVAAVKTGENIGSDHLPLVVELVIPSQK